jgi:hypothetical protein
MVAFVPGGGFDGGVGDFGGVGGVGGTFGGVGGLLGGFGGFLLGGEGGLFGGLLGGLPPGGVGGLLLGGLEGVLGPLKVPYNHAPIPPPPRMPAVLHAATLVGLTFGPLVPLPPVAVFPTVDGVEGWLDD